VIEEMIFACWTFDPIRFQPHLPPGLTLAANHTAVFALTRTRDLGWGFKNADWSFPAALVRELPSPDTSEACFIPAGLASPSAADQIARHFHPCEAGHSRITVEGDLVRGEVWAGDTPALRIAVRPSGAVSEDMSSLDRYIARNAAGDLVHFIVSAHGPSQSAALVDFDILPGAPSAWRAMAPVRLNWAMWIPRMLFNISAPEPFVTAEATGVRASRTALMAILDRQGRACGILDADGRILHANAALDRAMASHPALALRRVRCSTADDQDRLRHSVRMAAEGGAGAVTGHFGLSADDGAALILQIAPLDPVLAGPGTALGLFDPQRQTRPPPQAEILQLLGLTPAEARIAAAVGAGLPPRDAAARLGLAESTVRSSLKVIFDKLGVKRQAELVQIVARLEAR
jgi:DNA-binding CsgD family transcriptional regulator